MLFAIAALLGGAMDYSVAGSADTLRLQQIFAAACLDGSVSLSAAEASPIGLDQLPRALRKRLGKPTSGHAWRLSHPGSTYLYVLDYSSSPEVDPKVCGLASDSIGVEAASDVLEARISGAVTKDRGRGLQLLMPKDGYVAIATDAAPFTIMQINWLNDRNRAALAKHFRKVTP